MICNVNIPQDLRNSSQIRVLYHEDCIESGVVSFLSSVSEYQQYQDATAEEEGEFDEEEGEYDMQP